MTALRLIGLVFALAFSASAAQAADAIDDAFSRLEAAREGKANANTGTKKAAKSTTDSTNAIDAAFSNLDGGGTNSRPASGPASMDQAFEQADAERRRRIVEAQKRQAAMDYCNAAKARQESCMASACGMQPEAQVCTAQKAIQDDSPCNCSPKPCGCLRIPQYQCVAYSPNPKRIEWNACIAIKTAECTASTPRIISIEQCVADRLNNENRAAKGDLYGFCTSRLQVMRSELENDFSVEHHELFTPVQSFSNKEVGSSERALKVVESSFERHLDAHTKFVSYGKGAYGTRNTLCHTTFDSRKKAEDERNKIIKNSRNKKHHQVFLLNWRYEKNKASRLKN